MLGKTVNGEFPLFSQPLIVYLGFAFAVLLGWIFRSTNIGLNLRAAGEKPEALDAAGVSVVATRSYAVLATGALAGLGGAYLAIAGAGGFQAFLTQGQGFMAIVIAMLARGRPLGVVVVLADVRDRPLALHPAAARRDQHLDRRRPHASRSRRSSSR